MVNFSRRSTPISSTLSATDLQRVHTTPLNFNDKTSMSKALEGVDVFYCTYWIRFEKDGDSHSAAAERVKRAFEAASEAGVKKVVFSSHTRATVDSRFSYISGKAKAVEALREVSERSNMNYAVVRPCGIFGDTPSESILMNNAAYVLRRTPLFLLAGDGTQKFQPVHVRDMAELMAEVGSGSTTTTGEELDATGPDCPTARELFSYINDHARGVSVVTPTFLPTSVITTLSKPIDWVTGDILLDKDDLDLLGDGLTVANDPEDPRIAKRKSLFKWIDEVGLDLGGEYVSSVERYYKK
ncbi:hypothetical protein TrLO_g14945 [Triparma laevis f. longispina]|uniref:NAD(P)-binding domain-containing protein n=1 Tax=Triparma laevis f. longispina TaxID=1714387 RepID=A0A9W7FP35_9STRA|nr:hypothetical protein TrLO_g14945 [Triparma laevis f. longispina]